MSYTQFTNVSLGLEVGINVFHIYSSVQIYAWEHIFQSAAQASVAGPGTETIPFSILES